MKSLTELIGDLTVGGRPNGVDCALDLGLGWLGYFVEDIACLMHCAALPQALGPDFLNSRNDGWRPIGGGHGRGR